MMSGGGHGESTTGTVRKLTTVSGLAQHFESGACAGGAATFGGLWGAERCASRTWIYISGWIKAVKCNSMRPFIYFDETGGRSKYRAGMDTGGGTQF